MARLASHLLARRRAVRHVRSVPIRPGVRSPPLWFRAFPMSVGVGVFPGLPALVITDPEVRRDPAPAILPAELRPISGIHRDGEARGPSFSGPLAGTKRPGAHARSARPCDHAYRHLRLTKAPPPTGHG